LSRETTRRPLPEAPIPVAVLRPVALLLAGLLLLSGCTGPLSGGAPPGDVPDPSHHIEVENRLDRNVTLTVRVVRETTNEVVYEERRTYAPGDHYVYDTASADPNGVESFRVEARRGNKSASTTIQTNRCFQQALVVVEGDGVGATYVVC
jgi:hypothetical protein